MKAYALILILTLLSSTSLVQARPEPGNGASNKQQAVEIAQQQFPGRVLSVKHKGETYRVKILNQKGDVRIIKVKSANGNQDRHRQ